MLSSLCLAQPLDIQVQVDQTQVGMGRSVEVAAQVRRSDGTPAEGYLLLPYVNGRRWGAHEYADAEGRAVFHIPLPNPGPADITVASRDVVPSTESWIWAGEARDQQTVHLSHAFDVPPGTTRATLWCAVDDSATVYLNGEKVQDFGGWIDTPPVADLQARLRDGPNLLAVEARNGTGPAGLLVRLELEGPAGTAVIDTGPEWQAFDTPPADWPSPSPEGQPAAVIGQALNALWSGAMLNWPGKEQRADLVTGTPIREGLIASKPAHVDVEWRKLDAIPSDPEHLVGVQWEPWFTPLNASWTTAQAVPLMGLYWSFNRDVTRQHMLWLMESGTDFLIVDWTNHLWGKEHWDERPDGTNEIILATTLALEVLAELRDEGHPVPRVVLYPGLNNGPSTTMQAINEELDFIYNNYVRNPRFAGLFVEYLGKPLVIIHNGGGPGALEGQVPPNDEHFTIRWHSSQHDANHLNEAGYWSWMDGSLEPAVTYYEGAPECLTVSTAFFSGGGWLADTAYGRRGGWTYIESFKSALKYRARFIEIHQFQEFAGQPEGGGYGPDHNVYVDSYSVELSDDIEPVSLTTPAYRGDGGWGFLYLNLTRALVDLYRQSTPETTVLALARPAYREVVGGDTLEAYWTWAGVEPTSFTIEIDGEPVARDLAGTSTALDVAALAPGPHTLRLIANSTRSRYAMSYTRDSLPDPAMPPAAVEVPFEVRRP